MRRTKIASRELNSGAVEARSRQTFRDFGFPFRISRGLLHDKPFDAGVDPDAQHFRPQAFSCSISMDCRSDAGPLTGRSADNNVCADASKGADIVVDGDSGKVVSKKPPSSWIDLDELDGSKISGSMKAERVSTNVAKQIEHIHSRASRGLGVMQVDSCLVSGDRVICLLNGLTHVFELEMAQVAVELARMP